MSCSGEGWDTIEQRKDRTMIIQKIGVIGRTYRHMQRCRQILAILFKYGFGDAVNSLKIAHYLEIGLQ